MLHNRTAQHFNQSASNSINNNTDDNSHKRIWQKLRKKCQNLTNYFLQREIVFGYGKWTFSDEQGNETNYLSFDVFMGRSAKSRNVDLTPDVAYLYKDLSEYYKNKYPQAGVKTVVVSYAVSIK